jgi:hypothetical protein
MPYIRASGTGIEFFTAPTAGAGYYREGAFQQAGAVGGAGNRYLSISRTFDTIFTNGTSARIITFSLFLGPGKGVAIQVKNPDTNTFVTTTSFKNPTNPAFFIDIAVTLFTIVGPGQQFKFITPDGSSAVSSPSWYELTSGALPATYGT